MSFDLHLANRKMLSINIEKIRCDSSISYLLVSDFGTWHRILMSIWVECNMPVIFPSQFDGEVAITDMSVCKQLEVDVQKAYLVQHSIRMRLFLRSFHCFGDLLFKIIGSCCIISGFLCYLILTY